VSLHTSQDHTPFKNYRDGGTLEVRLNLSTLSGTCWGTCYSFNTSSRVSDLDCYGAGTMTFTACP
jgi:hypothetical protein